MGVPYILFFTEKKSSFVSFKKEIFPKRELKCSGEKSLSVCKAYTHKITKKKKKKESWQRTKKKWLMTIPPCVRRKDAIALCMIFVVWMAVGAGNRFAKGMYRATAARNGAVLRSQLHVCPHGR